MFPKVCYLILITYLGFALIDDASTYMPWLVLIAGGMMAFVGTMFCVLMRLGLTTVDESGKFILPVLWTAGVAAMVLGFGIGALSIFIGGAGLILGWITLNDCYKMQALLNIAKRDYSSPKRCSSAV